MVRRVFLTCLLLTALFALAGCAGEEVVEITEPPASTPVVPRTPPLSATPSPEPTYEEPLYHEENAPKGLTALEFAEEYPEPVCDEMRYGYIVALADGEVTFEDIHWYTYEERQAWMQVGPDETPREEEPPLYEPTGESLAYDVAEDCQYWILWESHFIYPARISAEDFDAYLAMTNWPMIFRLYISGGCVVLIGEQYRQ
ncbi:MAG TPA: hypothetical protein VN540_02425 [Clostridia bacterium]|nr:hypothetical protein [Clostridia bacterium]